MRWEEVVEKEGEKEGEKGIEEVLEEVQPGVQQPEPSHVQASRPAVKEGVPRACRPSAQARQGPVS